MDYAIVSWEINNPDKYYIIGSCRTQVDNKLQQINNYSYKNYYVLLRSISVPLCIIITLAFGSNFIYYCYSNY